MTETGFTRSIMRKLPPEIYRWKIMNIMQNGVPDCWFSGSAGDLWLEIKYITAPKRINTKIHPDLSDLQRKWLNERHQEGRNVAVLLGSDIGCYIFRNRQWDSHIRKVDLKLSRLEVVEWIKQQTIV